MYLLHVTHPSGAVSTITCPSVLVRALWIIQLACQPVIVRCEDRAVAA